jgi:hypothetical protein
MTGPGGSAMDHELDMTDVTRRQGTRGENAPNPVTG